MIQSGVRIVLYSTAYSELVSAKKFKPGLPLWTGNAVISGEMFIRSSSIAVWPQMLLILMYFVGIRENEEALNTEHFTKTQSSMGTPNMQVKYRYESPAKNLLAHHGWSAWSYYIAPPYFVLHLRCVIVTPRTYSGLNARLILLPNSSCSDPQCMLDRCKSQYVHVDSLYTGYVFENFQMRWIGFICPLVKVWDEEPKMKTPAQTDAPATPFPYRGEKQ